jgi:hypothetical protein
MNSLVTVDLSIHIITVIQINSFITLVEQTGGRTIGGPFFVHFLDCS